MINIPSNLPYKSLIILDPMEVLPPLIFFVGDGEYSRSLVNRRSIRNRTPLGSSMMQGRLAQPYFIWSYTSEITNRYQVELLEAYLTTQHRRSDITAPIGTLPYMLVADHVNKVPPEPISEENYEYIPGTSVSVLGEDLDAIFPNPVATLPAYSAGYKTGYGIFKVWITIDEKEYASMLQGSSCKYKLGFGLEQV